ncbi:MAG: hypothetical protein U0M51_01115 [Eggerthellaceae bacterium]
MAARQFSSATITFIDYFIATQPGFSHSMPSFAKNATAFFAQQQNTSRGALLLPAECRFSPRMRHSHTLPVAFCGKLGIEREKPGNPLCRHAGLLPAGSLICWHTGWLPACSLACRLQAAWL